MNPVKNQHYVPKFLIKNFSDINRSHVWTFDILAFLNNWKSVVEEKPIKSVASEEYFYEKEMLNEQNSLEHQLGKIENATAPIVRKLLTTANLNSLTLDDKDLLALFIALQMQRTKGSLSNVDRMNKDFTAQLEEKANLRFEKVDTKALWLSLIYSAGTIAKHLKNKTWLLLKCDKKFYLSDNPVVRSNTINPPGIRGTLGVNSDGIEIYFPLSHSITLALFCERLHIHIKPGTYEIKPEKIEYCNSLQVRSAERFVFSLTNDFNFVFNILNPDD